MGTAKTSDSQIVTKPEFVRIYFDINNRIWVYVKKCILLGIEHYYFLSVIKYVERLITIYF
jgi:hypothetical protein